MQDLDLCAFTTERLMGGPSNVNALAGVSSLTRLNLLNNGLLALELQQILANTKPLLNYLNLDGSRWLNNETLEFLPSQLASLSLNRNNNLTPAGLVHLARLPALTWLELDFCHKLVTPAGLAHLRGLPLTHLSLCGCEKLSNSDLQRLGGLPLTSLSLEGCGLLTDKGLGFLNGLPLVSFNVDRTGFSARGLKKSG